jgi:hypothetical protein
LRVVLQISMDGGFMWTMPILMLLSKNAERQVSFPHGRKCRRILSSAPTLALSNAIGQYRLPFEGLAQNEFLQLTIVSDGCLTV